MNVHEPVLAVKKQLEVLASDLIKESFEKKIQKPLKATGIEIFQINLGHKCNLSCRHCHVNAGTDSTEIMPEKILDKCLEILKESNIGTIDLTGGSPEMNPRFRWFLQECAKLNRRLLVRSNFTILLEKGHEDLIDLYTKLKVELVTSLPGFDEEKTDRQRGKGVFQKVIKVIKMLNEKGYAQEGSELKLNVVHNPTGAYLPGAQATIEQEYRQILKEKYGIKFDCLFTITNMPIGRYLMYLLKTENYEEYMNALISAYNPVALENVMCKTTVSVSYDGTLYDCDFNQMLHLPIDHGAPDNIMDFNFEKLKNRQIVTGNHCYGCTAGAGSSCQGEVAK